MELKNDNLWYIILFPILIVLLAILSAIGLSDTQFKQFEGVETNPIPPQMEETTP